MGICQRDWLMRAALSIVALFALGPGLSGCAVASAGSAVIGAGVSVVGTAVDVATAPINAVTGGSDDRKDKN
jgi:hypothetical protein